MLYPGFIGGSFTESSRLADQERTVNMYVQRFPAEAHATTREALYPWPGVTSFLSVATFPGRGMAEFAGRAFAVYGSVLYEVFSNATSTSRGAVANTAAEPMTFSYNGDGGGEVFMSVSGVGYLLTLATNMLTTEIASGSTMGAMLDGFFISLDADTSTFYISDLYDGTTWDPTQFAQRSIASDPWVSVLTPSVGREIWLFGTKTSEIWYNAGTAPFPFAPQPNALMPFGTRAPRSPASVAGSVCWLSQTELGANQVVQAVGSQPRIISTTALVQALDTYTTTEDAIGQSIEFQGHTFYVLTFPTAQKAWAYDLTTGYWTEIGTWDSATNEYLVWRPTFHAYAFGGHLLADLETGDVWQLALNGSTDVDGNPMRRLRRAPGLIQENERIYYSEIRLLMDVGVGNAVAPSDDPHVMIRMSNDGGYTWGNEYTMAAGAIGAYGTEVFLGRCGQARRRVFEVSMAETVPWRLQGAVLTIRAGA